jgi:hypothetical protein
MGGTTGSGLFFLVRRRGEWLSRGREGSWVAVVAAPVCCNGRGSVLLAGKGEENGGNGVEAGLAKGGGREGKMVKIGCSFERKMEALVRYELIYEGDDSGGGKEMVEPAGSEE